MHTYANNFTKLAFAVQKSRFCFTTLYLILPFFLKVARWFIVHVQRTFHFTFDIENSDVLGNQHKDHTLTRRGTVYNVTQPQATN